jgi:two-component system, cell cycle response regulator DivK
LDKKVVIVEDDKMNVNLFESILSKMEGVTFMRATDGIRGLELINSVHPDLIIWDLHLCCAKEFEICSQLRRIIEGKKIQIIAVRPYGIKGEEKNILGAGFNEYLPHPITITDFHDMVKKSFTG